MRLAVGDDRAKRRRQLRVLANAPVGVDEHDASVVTARRKAVEMRAQAARPAGLGVDAPALADNLAARGREGDEPVVCRGEHGPEIAIDDVRRQRRRRPATRMPEMR